MFILFDLQTQTYFGLELTVIFGVFIRNICTEQLDVVAMTTPTLNFSQYSEVWFSKSYLNSQSLWTKLQNFTIKFSILNCAETACRGSRFCWASWKFNLRRFLHTQHPPFGTLQLESFAAAEHPRTCALPPNEKLFVRMAAAAAGRRAYRAGMFVDVFRLCSVWEKKLQKTNTARLAAVGGNGLCFCRSHQAQIAH